MAKVTKQQYTGLVKLYNSLIGSHQLWELWQDSMTMFALAISNTVDRSPRSCRSRVPRYSCPRMVILSTPPPSV